MPLHTIVTCVLALCLPNSVPIFGASEHYFATLTASSATNPATENFARWHLGATLYLVENGAYQHIDALDAGLHTESILLSDNAALRYTVNPGLHQFIIDLGDFTQISRFFLNNRSASGTIEIMASNTLEPLDSSAWTPLGRKISFAEGVIPSMPLPEIAARYILIQLSVEKAGKIGNLGIIGPMLSLHY